MIKTFSPSVQYSLKWPNQRQRSLMVPHDQSLLIFDRKLLKNKKFKTWSRSFNWLYPVHAGEQLKDLKEFPKHISELNRLLIPSASQGLCIMAVGGGSVGDFSGFLASTYKRGVGLIHMPSTFLAALDSSHGGKNALNVEGVKNQIGSFYPAPVFIVKDLLSSLPQKEVSSAFGEVYKMALIESFSLWKKLEQNPLHDFNLLWKLLPELVRAKYKVVLKDPYEKKGVRQVLNLGHTLGHVFEAYYGLSHGVSVHLGLEFSLNWSEKRRYLSSSQLERIKKTLAMTQKPELPKKKIPRAKFIKLLSQDKKILNKNKLKFVFIKKPGQVFTKDIQLTEIIKESHRQGWIL